MRSRATRRASTISIPSASVAACRRFGVAFLEGCTPENVAAKIDEGVRVVAGHREETARIGRAHSKRTMPVG